MKQKVLRYLSQRRASRPCHKNENESRKVAKKQRGEVLYPCTLPRLDTGSHRLSANHSRLSAEHHLCAPGPHPGASGNSAVGSRPGAARNGFSRNEGLLSVSRLPVCLPFFMILNFRTICPILLSGMLLCLYVTYYGCRFVSDPYAS